MDLIYMNEKHEDVGVLSGYLLDLAYGKDENNFECTVDIDNHVCREKYMLYIDGTEYGGIIDVISPDTDKKEIVYSGRTWHGVLEKKIIYPDPGYEYFEVAGDANKILEELIIRLDLNDIFAVEESESDIDIALYRFVHVQAYSGIRDMLAQYDGKLRMKWTGNKIVLSAVPIIDYSQDEQFDSSQITFKLTKNYRPVNHVICTGTEGDERYTIHLYADEGGGIIPYATADKPVQDSDYILFHQNQQLFGIDEVSELYDAGNISGTENYVRLSQEPSDWAKNYTSYYQSFLEDDGRVKYKQVESQETKAYVVQTKMPNDWGWNYETYYTKNEPDNPDDEPSYSAVKSAEVYGYWAIGKPSDWAKNYKYYYMLDESGKYKRVASEIKKTYSKLLKKPSDWSKNYKDYYIHFTDGTSYEYRNVSGVSKEKYAVQTMKPSDWAKNFGNYYKRKSGGSGYETVSGTGKNKKTAPSWRAKRYYTKITYSVAPPWDAGKYYSLSETEVAPAWENGKYYERTTEKTTPDWETGKYYTEIVEDHPPIWWPWIYQKQVIDHYEKLVHGGLDIIRSSMDADKIEISVAPDKSYDIGDIVGAKEQVTGVEVWKPVTKKIVTINKDGEQVQYEIGW